MNMITRVVTVVVAMLALLGGLVAPATAVPVGPDTVAASQKAYSQTAEDVGLYVVNHPRDPKVCGKGWKWHATYNKAKHNKPRIASARLFYKNDRNGNPRKFCLITARVGKATGAHGPTLAAIVPDHHDGQVKAGSYAFFRRAKATGDPCAWITWAVKYGDQKASRRLRVCGK